MTLHLNTANAKAGEYKQKYGPSYLAFLHTYGLSIGGLEQHIDNPKKGGYDAQNFRTIAAAHTHLHYTNNGKVYELSRTGAEQFYNDIFGKSQTTQIYLQKDTETEIEYMWGRCAGDFNIGKTLLPTIKHNGARWVLNEIGEKSKTVGDNVSLTGGSKKSSWGESSLISKDFYCQTFSAGGGRVTAGVSGTAYFKEGLQSVSLFAEDYPS